MNMTYEMGTWPWEQGPGSMLAVLAGDFLEDFDIDGAAAALVDRANEILEPYGITTTVSGIAYVDAAHGVDTATLDELGGLLEGELDYAGILSDYDRALSGLLVPVNGRPTEVTIHHDLEWDGSHLHALQELVGGDIESFDVKLAENGDVRLYFNRDDLVNYEDIGIVTQTDCDDSILIGDCVAVGFDPETGEDRSLTEAEAAAVIHNWSFDLNDWARDVGMAHEGDVPSLSDAAAECRRSSSALSGETPPVERDRKAHDPDDR